MEAGHHRSPYEIEHLRGPFAAVVDTNVALDVYTNHDVAAAVRAGQATQVDYRTRRARSAWWLAMACDDVGLNTLGFTEEYRRVLVARVANSPAYSMWSRFISDYVKPTVSPRWVNVASDRDAGVRSRAADRLLVQMAAEHAVPVVTCEVGGDVEQAALAAGVSVYAPWDFAPSLGLPLETARQRFFERFDAGVSAYVARWSTRFEPTVPNTPREHVEQRCADWIASARAEFVAIWDHTADSSEAQPSDAGA